MEQQWISVKDRLPENHSLVIISMRSGAITVGRVMQDSSWGIFTVTALPSPPSK